MGQTTALAGGSQQGASKIYTVSGAVELRHSKIKGGIFQHPTVGPTTNRISTAIALQPVLSGYKNGRQNALRREGQGLKQIRSQFLPVLRHPLKHFFVPVYTDTAASHSHS